MLTTSRTTLSPGNEGRGASLPGAWLLRLPFAVSAFGLRQMTALLAPSSGPDLHPISLGWRRLDPMAFLLGSLREAAEAAATLPPASAAAHELRNKLAAFTGFRYADDLLGIGSVDGGRRLSPEELLRRAQQLPPRDRLWALEGLGYRFATRDGGWDGPEAGDLPLWTGRGLAEAEAFVQALADEPQHSGDEGLPALLDQYLSRARRSPAGSWQASYEALGLVLRLLRPRLLHRLHEVLQDRPEQQALLWHGAGRGLYFAPSELAPTSAPPWRALARARRAPSSRGSLNALAGLSWATTLVNLHSPEVIRWRLSTAGDASSAEAHSVAHGVTGAATTWLLATGDAEPVEALAGDAPEAVAAGCRRALQHQWPRLRAGAAIGPLFRLSEEVPP